MKARFPALVSSNDCSLKPQNMLTPVFVKCSEQIIGLYLRKVEAKLRSDAVRCVPVGFRSGVPATDVDRSPRRSQIVQCRGGVLSKWLSLAPLRSGVDTWSVAKR